MLQQNNIDALEQWCFRRSLCWKSVGIRNTYRVSVEHVLHRFIE